jgi:hypothetical protein
VIEATGKWHRQVHRSLHAAGWRAAVVNPLRARLFAEAIGALAKPVLGPAAGRTRGTDRLDARLLALFAASLAPAARPPAPAAVEALKQLVQARDSAITEAGRAQEPACQRRNRLPAPAARPPNPPSRRRYRGARARDRTADQGR